MPMLQTRFWLLLVYLHRFRLNEEIIGGIRSSKLHRLGEHFVVGIVKCLLFALVASLGVMVFGALASVWLVVKDRVASGSTDSAAVVLSSRMIGICLCSSWLPLDGS